MKKIPTLFRRDPDDLRHVLPEVTPGCEWVLAGEGVATRKYDGTCMMLDGAGIWRARREVKPGKEPPVNFREVDHDPVTDKRVGWEPVEQTGWGKYLAEALDGGGARAGVWHPGTYELCGPKINRNPEGCDRHILIRHADAHVDEVLTDYGSEGILGYVLLADILGDLGDQGWEGVVWHHPDGRMAKLKARDFA